MDDDNLPFRGGRAQRKWAYGRERKRRPFACLADRLTAQPQEILHRAVARLPWRKLGPIGWARLNRQTVRSITMNLLLRPRPVRSSPFNNQGVHHRMKDSTRHRPRFHEARNKGEVLLNHSVSAR
jgi:hypothetical protein